MPPFTPPLNSYPEIVRLNVRVHPIRQYGGFTRCLNGQADVHYCVGVEWTFYHQMGHAAAYILGIERTLGTLVMMQPGYQALTEDNPYSGGAQNLYCGHYDDALADYAAEALAIYIAKPNELHPILRIFIDRVFAGKRFGVTAKLVQLESATA